jgi:anti-sigma B factor antagonist
VRTTLYPARRETLHERALRTAAVLRRRRVNPCEVLLRRDDSGPVVVVRGEADISCAGALRERLLEVCTDDHIGDRVTVDLTNASFIDSTCLGVLVGATKRLSAAGARMTVIASPAARRSIRLAGLDRLWNVVDAAGM